MANEKTKTESAAGADAAKPEKRPKRAGKNAADAALLKPIEIDSGKKRKSGGRKKRGGKSSRLITLLIIVFVVLVILAGAAYVVINNLFGARDMIFDTLYGLDPRERAHEKVLEQRSEELSKREEEIEKGEGDITQRKDELDARASELDEESIRLEDLREQLAKQSEELRQREEENVPRYLQPMTEEELSDLKRLAKIYSTMSAEEAVEIMSALYDVQDMVAILYQMSNGNVAAILAAMEVSLAVEITEILLHE